MSYEGSEQHLCANGHLYEIDCYITGIGCDCGAESVFYNSVDDTNGERYGWIPPWEWIKLELTPIKLETCNLHFTHITEEPTYKVPDKPELIRYWYSSSYDEGNEYNGAYYHRCYDGKIFNFEGRLK